MSEGSLTNLFNRCEKANHWQRKTTGILACAAAVVLFGFLARPIYGQNITGTILGTVRDTSQAVVPNATVTAVHLGTNQKRTVVTNGSGDYVLPLLPVGAYVVTAELTGFKKAERTGITLQLEQRIRVDLTLSPGEMTQTVTVSENAPVVEAYSNERGLVVDNTKLVELPLNGRNFTDLVKLAPGVVDRNYVGGAWGVTRGRNRAAVERAADVEAIEF